MTTLREAIFDIVQSEFAATDVPAIQLSRPEPQFGDYATNIALQLTKAVGEPPRVIAERIAARLSDVDSVKTVSVAGPGFINIFVSDDALLQSSQADTEPVFADKTFVVELYNPNPLKPMHIGHAYNGIISDTIARLASAGGATVHGVSYHGDIGAHIGRSMWAILRAINGDPAALQSIEPQDRMKFLQDKYAEGTRASKEDVSAANEIDALAKQSFKPEGDFKTVYDTVVQWSFDSIEAKIQKLGGQRATRRYLESEADVMGRETVEEHIGDVFTKSEGAVIFDGSPYKLHTEVFIASNGNSLYAARDLGLMKLKIKEFNPDQNIIVTGGEQTQYFRVITKAIECVDDQLAGINHHIGTGLVKLSTGKMSSRTGDVLGIDWLFEQIESAMKERGGTADPDILIGALRYAFLKVKIGGDVVFDVNESLSLQGNSGPYLQYAHARARSIVRKSTMAAQKPDSLEPAERILVAKLSEYCEVVERASREFAPHLVCSYLYELAQAFNRFYEVSRVIGDPREAERLYLVDLYGTTLSDGLAILGIVAPEQM